jgi:hypothetical protein
MGRRLAALSGIVVIVGLLLLLMWRVYLHQHMGVDDDESSVVLRSVMAEPLNAPFQSV